MAMAPHGQAKHEHDHQHGLRSQPNNSHNRWEPYSGADDFARTMAVILAAILTAIPLALALDLATCYLLGHIRRARRGRAGSGSGSGSGEVPPPPPPALVYSSTSTKLAGAAAECTICLGEFADGDAIRVMPACRGGFHARCIDCWLAGGRRSSCPTCRAPTAVATGAGAAAQPDEAVASVS